MSRSVEALTPQQANTVSLYTCGLTVYSQPHIGNWAAYIYWDVLARMLEANGLKVARVQNITDVGHLVSDGDDGEDKLEKGAKLEGLTAWQVADKYTAIAENEAYDLLKLKKPTHMPKATDYIQQQIEFVSDLETKGYTYVIEDGVYFDTSKIKDYGKLAKLDIDGLRSGARVKDTGKKNPTDFALWKFSPKGVIRDMEWESPWGVGFPGWHLECSVMAEALLGQTIDIHTGGIDHIPIHHTNEIAQSEAHTGKPFAKTWLHNNHLKINGTKVSKSLGNIITLQDIQDRGYSLQAYKLMILSKHYRTEGNFTWKILESFQTRLNSWQATVNLMHQLESSKDTSATNEMLEALSNDLNTPQVLALIDEYFNKLLNNEHKAPNAEVVSFIETNLGISFDKNDISSDVKELMNRRKKARDNKDFSASDELRDEINELGYGIGDSPLGQIWYKK